MFKKKKLFFKSENLAVPEVKTGEVKAEDNTEHKPESGIQYDNLAIPEIKALRKKKDK